MRFVNSFFENSDIFTNSFHPNGHWRKIQIIGGAQNEVDSVHRAGSRNVVRAVDVPEIAGVNRKLPKKREDLLANEIAPNGREV